MIRDLTRTKIDALQARLKRREGELREEIRQTLLRSDSEQYAQTTALLEDAWLRRWPEGVDGQGRRFDRRIDHVFVSPGTLVDEARYITDPESDHPALVVEIK